jgi:hypothetical protein
MREVTEAHYLHERHGLEAVLRPPVGYPTALAWVPRKEELLVTTRDGKLHSVDPVLGTRVVAEDIGEAAALDIHQDRNRFLVVARNGSWRIGQLSGGDQFVGKHDFLGHIDAFFFGPYVILVGDEGGGRYLLVVGKGEVRSRVRLPKNVIALPDQNTLKLARSTPAGLQVIAFGKGATFKKTERTAHVLQRSRGHILGMTPTGIAVWTPEGGAPRSMRMPELTAADLCRDAKMLGMGTRHGAVALARLDQVDKRVHPDLVKAFDSPVSTVQFSDRGRWLATGGERLQIWTWED